MTNQEIYEAIKELQGHVLKLSVDVGKLKVKAGIWGLVGGLAVAIPSAFIIINIVKSLGH